MTSAQILRSRPDLFENHDVVFAADTSETVAAIRQLTFEGDMEKHLLFSPVAHSIHSSVQAVSSCSPDVCIVLTLAVAAAINIVVCYWLLRFVARTRFNAILFTLFYSATFASLVFFSIPETYVVTSTGILLVLRLLLDDRWLTLVPPPVAGAAVGVLALNNPPLLLLGAPLMYCSLRRPNGGMHAAAWNLVGMLLVFVSIETAMNGTTIWPWFQGYARKWADPRNLADPAAIAAAVTGLLGFGIVSPFQTLQSSAGLRDVGGYWSVMRLAVVLFYVCLLAVGCWRALSGGRAGRAILMWAVLTIGFYTYFNPAEAILYSPQLTGVVTLLLLRAYEGWAYRGRTYLSVAFVVVLACVNLATLFRS
jgi:hypothetical protein